MKTIGYAFFVLAFLFTNSLGAQSQGLGTLTGTVVDDSTHAPLPDVRVTATSPHLQGKQAVKSDSTGTYRIPQLPPGTYTISFENELYVPVFQGDIALDADRTLRFNVQLSRRAAQGH
jgi:hypothetical protein